MKRYKLVFTTQRKYFEVKWFLAASLLWKLLPTADFLLDTKKKLVLRKRVKEMKVELWG